MEALSLLDDCAKKLLVANESLFLHNPPLSKEEMMKELDILKNSMEGNNLLIFSIDSFEEQPADSLKSQ